PVRPGYPLPEQRIPPEGAPVGARYEVDGRGPIELYLRTPVWRQRFHEGGDLASDARGVYILRDAETGQLFKPGRTDHVPTRVGTEYQHWVDAHGIPLLMDYFPVRAGTKIELNQVQTALRLLLRREGWNLPVDFENAVNTTQGARVRRAGG